MLVPFPPIKNANMSMKTIFVVRTFEDDESEVFCATEHYSTALTIIKFDVRKLRKCRDRKTLLRIAGMTNVEEINDLLMEKDYDCTYEIEECPFRTLENLSDDENDSTDCTSEDSDVSTSSAL